MNKINYPTERLSVEKQSIEERELQLFIENDADLHRQRIVPIQTNLVTKIARGTFDINKAPLIYKYLIDDGIKKYNKENGGMSLTKAEKENLQNTFVNEFLNEAQYGNYENYLPKKYKVKKEESMTAKEKFKKVIAEWKDGKLESGGKKVEDFNQAIAIAFSEARTIDPNYGKKKSKTKKDFSKMNNPISLEKTKEIVEFLKDNPDEETYLFKFKGIDYEILDKVKKKDSEGKDAEAIHAEIEEEYYGPSKIKASMKKKSEAPKEESKPETKKHSVVMFEAIDPATGKIRNEDTSKFIRLSKDYSKLGIIEFKEYGRKMPFGHLRPINDIKIFYYSPELERILDKYKLHYILYDNKKELEEYLDTI